MVEQAKKTPTVSVQNLSDTHKPSDASRSGSSFEAANQAEKADTTVTRTPDPPPHRSIDSQDDDESKDKCGYKRASCTMIAETISLGILSLPVAMAALGLVPGIILMIVLGLVTTGTGYCYYLYKMRYPHVRSIPQALDNIFGAPGRWITDCIIMVYLVLLMAGHLILFSGFVQAFSTPEDAPCRVAIMAIACFINCLFTFYRKFARLGYVCIACCLSILVATFVCLGYLAANQEENLAKPGNFPAFAFTPMGLHFGQHGQVTTIFAACAAFSNILLSYSGSICYFNIIDEMENPKDFWKCLLITNVATITMYTIAGVGMYALAGQLVASPALGSAGKAGREISYGLALPTILLAAVILANVQSKRTEDIIYSWLGQDADDQHRSQRKAFSRANMIWYAIVIVWWSLAFVAGNSFPFFNPLLSIIGAITGGWICLGWPATYMLHIWYPEITEENGTVRKMTRREVKESGGWWRRYTATTKLRIMVPLMIFLIIVNIVATVVGLYGSILQFAELGQGRKPFSCAYDWR